MPKRIAVFCGSNTGRNPEYEETARDVGSLFASKGIGVVYGGGKIGLMGKVADAALAEKGQVIGVIPEKLMSYEVGHEKLTELYVVKTMHERKAMMAMLSDAFVALPGGIGTLEEIIEVFTWHQIGYHNKPCAFLNTNGYFDKFFTFVNHMVDEGFLSQQQKDELIIVESAEELLVQFQQRIPR